MGKVLIVLNCQATLKITLHICFMWHNRVVAGSEQLDWKQISYKKTYRWNQ